MLFESKLQEAWRNASAGRSTGCFSRGPRTGSRRQMVAQDHLELLFQGIQCPLLPSIALYAHGGHAYLQKKVNHSKLMMLPPPSRDKVSLCNSPDCSGTHFIHQAGLKLSGIHFPHPALKMHILILYIRFVRRVTEMAMITLKYNTLNSQVIKKG